MIMYKKVKKQFFFFVSFVALSIFFTFVGRYCRMASDGFAILRISHNLPKDPKYRPPALSNGEKEELESIFAQKFHYVGCGGQSYAFASDDGEYILKFFRFYHHRIPIWLDKMPLFGNLKNKRDSFKRMHENKLQRLLASLLITSTTLKEQSGVIYPHLQKTKDLGFNLHFYDKIGVYYCLNANEFAFVLQKKGVPGGVYLKTLVQNGELKKAHEKVDELFMHSIRIAKMGLLDRDLNFKSNLGFFHDHVFQLDLGSLSYNEKAKSYQSYSLLLNQSVTKFKIWLSKECPELISYFDEKLQELNESEKP